MIEKIYAYNKEKSILKKYAFLPPSTILESFINKNSSLDFNNSSKIKTTRKK